VHPIETILLGSAAGSVLDVHMATTVAPPHVLPPARGGGNLLDDDRALLDGLRRDGGAAFEEDCRAFGALADMPEVIRDGFDANDHPPQLVRYGPDGERADGLDFHPAWHRLMTLSVEHGVAGAPWADSRPGAHVARAAKFLMIAQAEAGITCPLAMTYSCVPALRLDGATAGWEPLVTAGVYDPAPLPSERKRGALIGMALTERSGGSDVQGSTTTAEPDGSGGWRVSGAKWFVSAAQSDAFFVLAQTSGGLSLLLVPRVTPDGLLNGLRFDRLKPKLGNRSNPTAEVELEDAHGVLVGDEGRGVRAIMTMIGGTRHDCVLGSTAVMRLGTAEALHWATNRVAFGRPLAEQPAMRAVLADLALESEAATAGAMRLARANEAAHRGDGDESVFARLAAPVLKYWTCKRAPQHLGEALECQGGFGYIEESRLARAYREAPLMSVWEGSGNVQALDVLRALGRSPDALGAVLGEVALAEGGHRVLDAELDALRRLRPDAADEAGARLLAGRLARAIQAALLVRHAPDAVADAFCVTRVGPAQGRTFGELPPGVDVEAIVERARPQGAR
jgi:putative acyl-CoA dehydrogenase